MPTAKSGHQCLAHMDGWSCSIWRNLSMIKCGGEERKKLILKVTGKQLQALCNFIVSYNLSLNLESLVVVQIILLYFTYHLSYFVLQDEDGVRWVENKEGKVAWGIAACLCCSFPENCLFCQDSWHFILKQQ